nr:immunoglobulin heavy chain junction region [Macaca mulatta]MOV53217.1 immunoglobulin heavy chain junction region [Macaca mulatta]
CARQDSNLGYW